MRAGSLNRADRPLWYDIYEAFPPRLEPRFDRPVKIVPVMPIFYPEDTVRARFQREFGEPQSSGDLLVERWLALRRSSPETASEQLYEAAVDALRAEGVPLGLEALRAQREATAAPTRPAAAAADTAKTAPPMAMRIAELFMEAPPSTEARENPAAGDEEKPPADR